jgi:hypothetical protein
MVILCMMSLQVLVRCARQDVRLRLGFLFAAEWYDNF